MSDFQYLTPCLERSSSCNFDWAALAAVGGVAAAIITLLAVGVALQTAKAQREAAERAAQDERKRAEELQAREWSRIEKEHKRRATQLAHGFAKELVFARRNLAAVLIQWDPNKFCQNGSEVGLPSFAATQPFPDLVFLRSCTEQLQGFKDEDAFSLFAVLTSWQFFNQGPGVSIDVLRAMPLAARTSAAKLRVKFGLELMDAIEVAINRMAAYYESHSSISKIVSDDFPEHIKKRFEEMRGSESP